MLLTPFVTIDQLLGLVSLLFIVIMKVFHNVHTVHSCCVVLYTLKYYPFDCSWHWACSDFIDISVMLLWSFFCMSSSADDQALEIANIQKKSGS